MLARFRGCRSLVTGGSSGIGRSTALLLAQLGASVVVAARREEPLRKTAEELRRAAREPRNPMAWVLTDVADAAAADRCVQEAESILGGLDLVINCAGATYAARFQDTPLEVFRTLLDVNVLGIVHITRAALPSLARHPSGHVANVSSLAGVQAVYGYTAYAATKYAVVGFSEALRQELRPVDVGVSVLLPPDVDTPQLAEERRDRPAPTRALAGQSPVLSPEFVAGCLLDGIARGRFQIVPSLRARLLDVATRLAPGISRSVMDRIIERTLKGDCRTP